MAESQKQRLERIAVPLMAAMLQLQPYKPNKWAADEAIAAARVLMKQIDELPPID